MAKTAANGQKAKTARSGSEQAGEAKNFPGQNAVGEINARDSARVSIKQIVYTQLSEIAEERERQESELETLHKAIVQKYADLKQLVASDVPVVGNPYLFLQPFGFADQARFFGRDDVLSELMGQLIGHPCTFLCGNRNAGKTSLLKAGLVPTLISQGHLPLFTSVTGESLAVSLKKCLLPNLGSFQFLKAMALTEFLHIVSAALPPGKNLFVLVDDFEGFFQHTQVEQDDFRNEWLRYLNSALPHINWLFCIPSDAHHLLNFFKPEIHPNTNMVSIPPLSRESGREALVKPAEMRGILIHEEVIASILDALGGNHIDPASLQLVGYMLAVAKGTLIKDWDLTYYTERGRADGILRDYLDLAITELDPLEREPAWEILAVLADAPRQAFTEGQIAEKMALFGVKESTTRRILAELQSSNLVEHAEAYHLSSDSLRPRIEKWQETRSVLVRAHQEAFEQLQNIRNSGLRGLVGGALGFALIDQLLFTTPLPDLSYEFFSVFLVASFGALTGLLMTFSIDIAIASYTGPKKPVCYLIGGISGALAFILAMLMYANLNNTGNESFLALIPKAVLEGGLWGAVAGIGTVWVLSSRRPPWLTTPLVILLCGLVLAGLDFLIRLLANSKGLDTTPLTIALSGALFPGLILAFTLAGKRAIL